MNVLDKIVDLLIEKQWVVFIVSLLCATPMLTIIPSDFYEKLPFSSRDVNVVICYAFITLLVYMLISLILSFIDKIKRIHNNIAYDAKNKEQVLEYFDRLKSDNDKLTDKEFSILMYLIENENKIPYIEFDCYGSSFSRTILADNRKFYSSPYSGTPREESVKIAGTNEVQKVIHTPSGTQYLLNKGYYEVLCALISETGSITHFPKKRIELNQDRGEAS